MMAVHKMVAMLNSGLCRYAVFVMEASNSNRLTYFFPPLVCTAAFYLRSKFGAMSR